MIVWIETLETEMEHENPTNCVWILLMSAYKALFKYICIKKAKFQDSDCTDNIEKVTH